MPLMTFSELRHGAVSVCDHHNILTPSNLDRLLGTVTWWILCHVLQSFVEPSLCLLVGTESVCKERWHSIRVGQGAYLARWTKDPLPTALPNTQSTIYPLENPTPLPGWHLISFFHPFSFFSFLS